MKTIKQSILIIVIGLALASGISFAAGTWSNPTANPTGGNTDAPINTGSSPQAKSAELALAGLALGLYDFNYIPDNGLYVQGGSFFQGSAVFNTNAEVVGKTKTATLQVTSDAASGNVLISDTSGNATWQRGFSKPNYDSGWKPSSNDMEKGNEYSECPSNFTSVELENAVVLLEGKGGDTSGYIHQINFGTDSGAGAKWYNKTGGTCLYVKRAGNDSDADLAAKWKKYRVRIWKVAL